MLDLDKDTYAIGDTLVIIVRALSSSLPKGSSLQATFTIADEYITYRSEFTSIEQDTQFVTRIPLDPQFFGVGDYRITVSTEHEQNSKNFRITTRPPALKTLTICYLDLSDFSKLSHSLKARNDVIFEFLKDYFALASKIISKHDGLVDKFIGDGVMALFGMESRDPRGIEHALSAAEAALEMKEQFEKKIWLSWEKKIQSMTEETVRPVKIKCGINTGECVVGSIDIRKGKSSFTALGNAVNIASRMEGLASGGQIIVSKRTASLIENNFYLEKRGSSDLSMEGTEVYDYFEVSGRKH